MENMLDDSVDSNNPFRSADRITKSLTRSGIQTVLEARGLRPLKQLGQNFLIDANICRAIVASLPAKEGDAVLEIGPGLGALTTILLEQGWKVSAVEIDRGLATYLLEKYETHPHLHLIQADALEYLASEPKYDWVIGNLPYNISTPLLTKTMLLEHLPKGCVFTLQKEVAQRLVALPKTKEYGAVSILAQSLYEVKIDRVLSGKVFYPVPEVESAVVKFVQKTDVSSWLSQRENFYKLVRLGFSHRRKMLKSLLPVDLTQRAEELNPREWRELYESCRPQ